MRQPQPKKKLDTVVKLGLFVLVGSFALIWGGMFLTRPDRSIPPYSIGSQAGTAVAVHVPGWTGDAAIETLIGRFRKIGKETRDFGRMKIQPTTPGDPRGRYSRITIYIFTDDAWTEPEVLHRYLEAGAGASDERALKESFEKAVRGFYRLDELEEEGRIGPLLGGKDSAGTAAYSRELFKGPAVAVSGGESAAPAQAGVGGSRAPARSPAPAGSGDRGL